MHVVGKYNYLEAQDAVRDILMTYVELAGDIEGGLHNADVYVRFDPFKFVDAVTEDKGVNYVDLDLLRTGAAVAILCGFYNLWIEEQELREHPLTRRFEAAAQQSRLASFPDIEGVITEAIRRNGAPMTDTWIEGAVRPIFRKYVLSFFAGLVAPEHSAE